jgi:biopolymer transport protein TolR
MAMSIGAPRRGSIADINVTPMADVMIVLLVIFMLATPVIVGAPVRLPPAAHAVEHAGERLEIVVRATGEITAGGLTFTGADSLAEWISARRAGGPGPVVLVQADRGVNYGRVAILLSACRHAGVQKIALATTRAPALDRGTP